MSKVVFATVTTAPGNTVTLVDPAHDVALTRLRLIATAKVAIIGSAVRTKRCPVHRGYVSSPRRRNVLDKDGM
jgi:hypothetical protein